MGTFHNDKGDLHGITVVVDTVKPVVYIGRCWEMDDERVVLLDVDEHEEGSGGRSKQEFINQAAKVGVWKRHDQVVVPRSIIKSITRLGDVSPS